MSLVITEAAITGFINNAQVFKSSIENRFASLDANGDGLISFMEMAKELMGLRMLHTCFDVDEIGLSHPDLVELHRDIFSRFDSDGSRAVDLEEFGEEMKEMLIAVADRIGTSKNTRSWIYAKL
ncbi:hypothetical protein M5K25_011529 [Dendrobium thyrsiflorum]|uniref:EF-hand domain-containing protein n=1 Tax=Dendrobium thyrsiflorum TaxID=117978 RepID=A0ABD0V2Y0_DENTH